MSPSLLLASLLAAGGCPGGAEQTVTEISSACPKASGDALAVDVLFSGCISSSCDTIESARCELTRDGDTITVTGEAVVRSKRFGACTDDCGAIAASCTLELAPGDYTLVGAGEDIAFTHPVQDIGENEFCAF